MILMIDNYDSFVHNLAAYFRELGEEVIVKRSDALCLGEIKALAPKAMVFSPGPKTPQEAGLCREVFRAYHRKIPILGVCLGHQVIASALGAVIRKGETPVHGKVTPIHHNGSGLFQGLPATFDVTRYHSLVADFAELPPEVSIDAVAANQTIMGISHKNYPIFGVQFHPEAVLTQYGHELIGNFLTITKEWWQKHDSSRKTAENRISPCPNFRPLL